MTERQQRSWLLATVVPAPHEGLLQDAPIPETRAVPCRLHHSSSYTYTPVMKSNL